MNDRYDIYAIGLQESPRGPEKGENRVIRGGGWNSSPAYVRSASRNRFDPACRNGNVGFRLARTNPHPLPSISFTLVPPRQEQQTKQKMPPSVAEPLMVHFEKGGSFKMGDIEGGGDTDESPVHEVSLAPFAMGKFEVTYAEYVNFLNQVKKRGTADHSWVTTEKENKNSRILGENGKFTIKPGYEQHPVSNVSWYGAVAYADWLGEQTGNNYRLPTEAEWEYASRAGTETKWSFSNNAKELDVYAWYSNNSGNESHPVGQRQANPWGLYDVHGNVWEWVNDWYGVYATGLQENPRGPEKGVYRVLRGGGWDSSPAYVRSASRYRVVPAYRIGDVGFRLARTL